MSRRKNCLLSPGSPHPLDPRKSNGHLSWIPNLARDLNTLKKDILQIKPLHLHRQCSGNTRWPQGDRRILICPRTERTRNILTQRFIRWLKRDEIIGDVVLGCAAVHSDGCGHSVVNIEGYILARYRGGRCYADCVQFKQGLACATVAHAAVKLACCQDKGYLGKKRGKHLERSTGWWWPRAVNFGGRARSKTWLQSCIG